MNKKQSDPGKIERHKEFLRKLSNNELEIPNEFTEKMGNLIKKAREEEGLNQSQLAKKLSRSQATISDIENGKIEIGIITLVQIAQVFGKPISYFIPDMTFLISLADIHNKYEEEALAHFREIDLWGDIDFTLKFLKFLSDYYYEERKRYEKYGDMYIPDEEE